tara:strand:- start:209 stop:421 length:213 start_codon:yes stop_codon:yes gene_type:complete
MICTNPFNPPKEIVMEECFVFDEDGRFTGTVVNTVNDMKEAQKEITVSTTNLVLRYNILLEAFQPRRLSG